MTRPCFLIPILALSLIAAPVFAQDKKAETPPGKEAPAPEKKSPESVVRKKEAEKKETAKSTPITKWIAAENALIDPLSQADKESIYILRQKHSIIRVIGVVERDIGNAVKSCAKANPDMKAGIEGRFDQWKKAVKPVIDTARKNLDAEIDKQEIVDRNEFKKVLKLNDEAFEYGDKMTVKDPVSSKEACEALVESMDDTEDDMIKLLQDTLLPPSVIKSRVDREKKSQGEQRKSFSKSAQ